MSERKQHLVRPCASCGAKNRIPVRHLADTGSCGACAAVLPALSEPIDADTCTFDRVVAEARVPVLVDFWAPWCPPCRLVAPAVKKVAAAMAGRAIVLKVDTDACPGLAESFDVRGIPNFVVLKDGRRVRQHAGRVGHREMQTWLEDTSDTTSGRVRS
jgi:thioredoxin 2